MSGIVEHRTMATLTWAFRKDGPGGTVSWTRRALADATGLPEAYLIPHLEALADVGFLSKGKMGARAVYARTEECRIARPDLPQGWWWSNTIGFPRGERTVYLTLNTPKWHPAGHPFTLVHLDDPPKFAGYPLGSEQHVRDMVRALGSRSGRGVQADVDAWKKERDEVIVRARGRGFELVTRPSGDYLQAPLDGDRDLLERLAQFGVDEAFIQYRSKVARYW